MGQDSTMYRTALDQLAKEGDPAAKQLIHEAGSKGMRRLRRFLRKAQDGTPTQWSPLVSRVRVRVVMIQLEK